MNEKNNQKTKFTLEFNSRTTKLLEELAKDAGATRVEVVRRALALYSHVDEEVFKKQGMKLSVVNSEDRVVKDLVIAS